LRAGPFRHRFAPQAEDEGCDDEEGDGDVLVIARGCQDAGRGRPPLV